MVADLAVLALDADEDGESHPTDTLGPVATVATNDRVGRGELDAFLRTRHKAVVVTRRGDGGDQTSPVTLGAEVLDLPAGLDPLCEYFRSISGEHPDGDEYREAMARQGKCLIRLTVAHRGPIATGGFPARLATA